MNLMVNAFHKTRRSGQTLIIALLVMGALLIVGLVFLGIVSRGINQTSRSKQRTLATDLADAGIRFAQDKLLNSEDRADWRPRIDSTVVNTDPDYDYLNGNGPDGKGAYSRLNFDTGRALIRVRYEPVDVFAKNSRTVFRDLAAFRNFLIVESVGRAGKINLKDPTLAGRIKPQQDKMVGLVYLPTLSHTRYVSNANNVTRPADIGSPSDMNIVYQGEKVIPSVELGNSLLVYNFGSNTLSANPIPAFGSVHVNGNVRVHGDVRMNLSGELGDAFSVSGSIIGDNDTSKLTVTRSVYGTGPNWTSIVPQILTNVSNPSLSSGSSDFSTLEGVLLDGGQTQDAAGYSRGVGTIQSPSILGVDPQSGENSYVHTTRDSGAIGAGIKGNSGQYGYGRGVFVNNFGDHQGSLDESQRQSASATSGLVYDWLNPNNGGPDSGWQGPYYIPKAAYVLLQKDGFTIFRDQRAPASEKTWKNLDGSDSGQTVVRYRFKGGVLLNSIVSSDINSASPDLTKGVPFNGVLYFAGNVRVRGVIPTDVQMHIISNGSIYIEGSITKGLYDGGTLKAKGESKSCLGLSAREYTVLNTTMFNGPAPGALVDPVRDVPESIGQKPVRIASDGNLPLFLEELLDPNASTATSWISFAENYREFNSPDAVAPGPDADMTTNNGPQLQQRILFSHTMDDGPGSNSFIAMDVNPGVGTPTFNFPGGLPNAASQYAPFTAAATIPMWGLGIEPWQRFTKFETISFPLINYTGAFTSPFLTPVTAAGTFSMRVQDTQVLNLRGTNVGSVATNDYMLQGVKVVPQDIRIEAMMFAEQGSFFVIPGPWFNPNADDRREVFNAAVAAYGGFGSTAAIVRAQKERQENFGNSPEVPFYGEPTDTRIRIEGSISENMPPQISVQAEWIKKHGWIPHQIGCAFDLTGASPRPILIPQSHVPRGHGYDLRPTTSDPASSPTKWVPNLLMSFDPMFATGRTNGFDRANSAVVRFDEFNRPLPPVPKLPVSPTLAYFGEVTR